MKRVIAYMTFLMMLSSQAYAAPGMTLRNSSGTEVGTASNPISVQLGAGGDFELGDASIDGTTEIGFDPDNDNTNEVTINSDGSITINDYTLPSADGTNGQVMKTDGLGSLSFGDTTDSPIGGDDMDVQFNSSGVFTGEDDFSYNTTSNVLSVNSLDITGANTIYLDASDDIQTAVTAATAGDMIVLAPGTYSISTGITIDKALTIQGAGPESTIISLSAEVTAFSGTASNIKIMDLKITGAAGGGIVFSSDGVASTSGCYAGNIHVLITADTSTSDGIGFRTCSGTAENCVIDITQTVGSSQSRALYTFFNQVSSANNVADEDCVNYFRNCNVYLRELSTGTGQIRPFMAWYDGSASDPVDNYNCTVYLENSSFTAYPFSTSNSQTEMANFQGQNADYVEGDFGKLECFVKNTNFSVYHGTWDASNNFTKTTPASTSWKIRIDDRAIVHFLGSTWDGSYTLQSQNNGKFYRSGELSAGNWVNSTPQQAPAHLAARDLINIVGQQGGDKPSSGTTTAVGGADVVMTLGDGGTVTGTATTINGASGGRFILTSGVGSDATDTATSGAQAGGEGGDFTFTGGNGGNCDMASGINTNGGQGSDFFLVAGNGGTASGGSTTNDGGAGGDIQLAAGAGGVGTGTGSSTGRDGTVAIGIPDTAVQTAQGRVIMAMLPSTIAADDVTPDVRYSSMFKTSANTGATAITDLDNPTPGQIIIIYGGSNTNSSTIADSGNFNLSGAMTLSADDAICLYVQADNDYIELWRVDN